MGNPQRKSEDDVVFSTESSSTTTVSSISAGSSAEKVRKASRLFFPSMLPDDIAREAVNNHLRYLRSRGTTHISAQDVARALSLSTEQVKRVAVQVGAMLED